jgi:hypothetical protein
MLDRNRSKSTKDYQPFSMALVTVITIMNLNGNLKGLKPLSQILCNEPFINTPKSSSAQQMILPKISSD